MTNLPEDLAPGIGDDDEPVMLIGDEDRAAGMAELIDKVPELRDPAHATPLALAVNHFAHGTEFRLIADPAAFAAAFRARLARENPAAPFQEGVVRVSDLGVPDFAAITPPVLDGETLHFFAEDLVLGVPYQVRVDGLAAAPSYVPMPLEPVRPA